MATNALSAFSFQVAKGENGDAQARGFSEKQSPICLELIYMLISESLGLESGLSGWARCRVLSLRAEF